MAKFITANRTLSAALVPDSLCNIRIRKIIDQATRDLIDKLLLEKIPLAGIARVVGVSEPWLQNGSQCEIPKCALSGGRAG